MPTPIVCLAGPLRQFLETFRGLFSARQWKYFVTVLLALILCEERRTLQALLRTVADRLSLAGLCRFLSLWPWSEEALATAWQARFRAQLARCVRTEHARQRAQRPKRRGRPKATLVTGYLILDEQRAKREAQRGELVSRGEARRLVQAEQRKQLLAWLSARVRAGAKLRELHASLLT